MNYVTYIYMHSLDEFLVVPVAPCRGRAKREHVNDFHLKLDLDYCLDCCIRAILARQLSGFRVKVCKVAIIESFIVKDRPASTPLAELLVVRIAQLLEVLCSELEFRVWCLVLSV